MKELYYLDSLESELIESLKINNTFVFETLLNKEAFYLIKNCSEFYTKIVNEHICVINLFIKI